MPPVQTWMNCRQHFQGKAEAPQTLLILLMRPMRPPQVGNVRRNNGSKDWDTLSIPKTFTVMTCSSVWYFKKFPGFAMPALLMRVCKFIFFSLGIVAIR